MGYLLYSIQQSLPMAQDLYWDRRVAGILVGTTRSEPWQPALVLLLACPDPNL